MFGSTTLSGKYAQFLRVSFPRMKWALCVFAGVGRLHITVIAALGVVTFGWLFTGRYPWFLMAVCALDWYLVNLMNRIVDLEEDQVNEIMGARFVLLHRRWLLGLSLAVFFTSIPVVHLLNPKITLIRITSHLLGALYNWPLLPGRRRLKQLYFWKNTASALGFLITLFGYPLATFCLGNTAFTFPRGITWLGVLFTAVFFFLFEISYEVIYDLRDVKGDGIAGIRTYPVVHGEAMAVHIVDGLLFSSVAVLVFGYVLSIIPWRIFIMVAAPLLQFFFYRRALPRGITPQDCIMLTWLGAGLLFVYHLWIVAGFPGSGF
jgi:4-hydroxybenzoate polyprenyltransferase